MNIKNTIRYPDGGVKSLKDYGKKVIARLRHNSAIILSTLMPSQLRGSGFTKSHCYVVVDDFIKIGDCLEHQVYYYSLFMAYRQTELVKGVL